MDVQLFTTNPSSGCYSTYLKEHSHTRGMKKNEFQLKLLFWFLVQALKKNYLFKIATKIVSADMFDDLVFHCSDNGEGRYRLVHILYTQSEWKSITLKNLISPKQNYGLPKCFFSYQKTKNRMPFLGEPIQDVVLFTNSNLAFNVNSTLRNFLERLDHEDDFFQGNCYKLTGQVVDILKGPFSKKLHMILEELAQCFIDCIIHPCKKGPQKEVLYDYTGVLCTDVVDVTTRQFRPEFLANSQELTDGARKFRSILEPILKRKMESELELETLVNDSRISLQYFSQLSLNRKKDFLPWPDADEKEVKDFVDHLVLALDQPTKLETKIQAELARRFSSERVDNIFHYLQRNLASWCRQTTGRWLTNEEVENWMIVAKFQFATRYEADFEQTEFIASGGFGAVYKARNKVDNTDYAIKKILIRPKCAEKIFREVRLLASLHHPHIVPYKNAWLDSCSPQVQREIKKMTDDSGSYSEPYNHYTNSSQELLVLESLSNENEVFEESSVRDSRILSDQPVASISSLRMILYIQMQFCPETLRKWLDDRNARTANGSLEDNRKEIEIFRQILQGIHYIHSQQIVHRDIKPENIFLCRNTGNALIGDFGLAKILSSTETSAVPGDTTTLSQAGSALIRRSDRPNCVATKGVGTKSYAAPEQLETADYGAKSDLYSLGVVLMELLVVFKTSMERVKSITTLREMRQVPESLQLKWPLMASLVLELTSESPKDRPSPNEIIDRLISPNLNGGTAQEDDTTVEGLRRQIEELKKQLSEKDVLIEQLQFSST